MKIYVNTLFTAFLVSDVVALSLSAPRMPFQSCAVHGAAPPTVGEVISMGLTAWGSSPCTFFFFASNTKIWAHFDDFEQRNRILSVFIW